PVEYEHLDVPLEEMPLERLCQRRFAAARHAGEPYHCAAVAIAKMSLASRDLGYIGVDARLRDHVRRGKPLRHIDHDAAAGHVESIDEHQPAKCGDPLEQVDRYGTSCMDDHLCRVVRTDGIGARD